LQIRRRRSSYFVLNQSVGLTRHIAAKRAPSLGDFATDGTFALGRDKTCRAKFFGLPFSNRRPESLLGLDQDGLTSKETWTQSTHGVRASQEWMLCQRNEKRSQSQN